MALLLFGLQAQCHRLADTPSCCRAAWDDMRAAAQERYQRGEMPAWFKPEWLELEEAPPNSFWRERGVSVYQSDVSGFGLPPGDNGGGGRPRGGGGGWGDWWREDDPYWPLRDWGDHPMRLWTLAYAALLAAGALWSYAASGLSQPLQVGAACAASLLACGVAMSDVRHGWLGPLGVKAAWATCAALAAKEYFLGWEHKPAVRYAGGGRQPHNGQQQSERQARRLGGAGASAVAMCVMYMWTGMGELGELRLPDNPGAAFKMQDIAQKQRIWARWGYARSPMRQ